ncbi:hypothetical protein crov483 [Cafeteria roenbergensis virus]|uniref:Uncharacterized protein n=1 Tax=Cafeteria roenbergensis virus (strain BV-PW1) TaxID=693272 RepID=E3T5Q4_CROVB|nr:hypothetical protein crov483 [Cafeteria roenbergensis virus BV-PW1]ADO67517.1 hypothetical protein crov483 [Cafeteria roenbergensis virus BV-PW1]
MADINHAYDNILDNSTSNIRKISHFFTQRKITESQDILNPDTLQRTKKDINFTQNYLALVLPKDEKSPILRIEIYGTHGYCYQGEIISYTDNNPHLLIPLNNDKEIFVNIYDYNKNITEDDTVDTDEVKPHFHKKEKNIKYIAFIHVPKRYQNIDDYDLDSPHVYDLKNQNKETTLQNKYKPTKTTKSIQVEL